MDTEPIREEVSANREPIHEDVKVILLWDLAIN
jgi:hypothetical protein